MPEIRIIDAKSYIGANIFAPRSALWLKLHIVDSNGRGIGAALLAEHLRLAGVTSPAPSIQPFGLPFTGPEILPVFAQVLREIIALGITGGVPDDVELLSCDPDAQEIVLLCEYHKVARQASNLLALMMSSPLIETITKLSNFIEKLKKNAYAPISGVLLAAAKQRGIPFAWQDHLSCYQLGHGRHRKWIDASITSNLPALGYEIARRKPLTNELFRKVGLPVPRSIPVSSLSAAVRAASEIGFPVVVKPTIGHKGIGITVGVQSPKELKAAYLKAAQRNSSVLIEQLIPGADVRLLVIGKKLIAAARRSAPYVTGDGKSTIRQLIEAENARRKLQPGIALPIQFDNDLVTTLLKSGLGLSDVLGISQTARLRTVANWSQGGTAIDVTDRVHPDNADMAIRAALTLGLDVSGVDFITTDISKPYYETGGAICEVNYRPGFRVHLAADPARTRDLAGPVIDSLFESDGRMDIIYVLGGKSSGLSIQLEDKVAESGRNVRVISTYASPVTWQTEIATATEDPDCDVMIIQASMDAVKASGAGVTYCSCIVRADDTMDSDIYRAVFANLCGTDKQFRATESGASDDLICQVIHCLRHEGKKIEPVKPLPPARTMKTIAAAAIDLNIPTQKLITWRERPLLHLGYGNRIATYRGARTGRTSYLSTRIADDKNATQSLLRKHGLPCVDQTVVATADAALLAVRKVGYPVIVKPLSSSESRGVTGDIVNDEELAKAVAHAFQYSRKIVVEPFLKGTDHRFLVIGGKVVHVTRHLTASVRGDGHATVRELVNIANQDPIRGPDISQPYTSLELADDAIRMLQRQELDLSSVPAVDQLVILSSICAPSTGATAVDVTALAHLDNVAAAERAARLIGLDICGVDFFLSDVAISYKEGDAAILEVNQRPSFDMHHASTGFKNNIPQAIISELVGDLQDTTIPVIHCLVPDAASIRTSAEKIMNLLQQAMSMNLGMAFPELGFAMIGNAKIAMGEKRPDATCQAVLYDPRVEAAIFVTESPKAQFIPPHAKVVDLRTDLNRSTQSDKLAIILSAIVQCFKNGDVIRPYAIEKYKYPSPPTGYSEKETAYQATITGGP